jgi:hypothetical protein
VKAEETGGEREGDFRDNSNVLNIHLKSLHFYVLFFLPCIYFQDLCRYDNYLISNITQILWPFEHIYN